MKDRLSVLQKLINKRKKIIIALAIIAAVTGTFYYRSTQAAKPEKVTATVQRGPLTQTLALSGSVKSDSDITLNFQTAGKLSRLAVREGDIVKKGQVIASLDQRSVRKNLDKTLNTFVKSRLDLDQQRDTYDDTITSDTIKRILEKAQNDVNNAVIDVELQNLVIEYSNLYSPTDGIVTSTYNLQPGMNVTAATSIVDIVGPDPIYFELTADQTEVTTLRNGMEGELALDAYLDEKLPGTISFISFTPKAGESNIVYVIKFSFMNKSNSLLKYKVGMTGDVSFVTAQKDNALYVPFAFVQDEQGKKYVHVMKKGKLEKLSVQTGMETDDSIEIISGLSEGDVVYD